MVLLNGIVFRIALLFFLVFFEKYQSLTIYNITIWKLVHR